MKGTTELNDECDKTRLVYLYIHYDIQCRNLIFISLKLAAWLHDKSMEMHAIMPLYVLQKF